MTNDDKPAARRLAPVAGLLAGAGMILAACAPAPDGAPTARQSSMLAAQTSCPTGVLESRFDQPIDPANPDGTLASEAFRYLVNLDRCRHGIAPLAASSAATLAASGQAATMARYDFMGHSSPIPGHETVDKRINAQKASYRIAAENVARIPLCVFRAAGQAPEAVRPSYRAVAEKLHAMWMESAAHTTNILDPRFHRTGAGMAVQPGKGRCGELAAAAVFMG